MQILLLLFFLVLVGCNENPITNGNEGDTSTDLDSIVDTLKDVTFLDTTSKTPITVKYANESNTLFLWITGGDGDAPYIKPMFHCHGVDLPLKGASAELWSNYFDKDSFDVKFDTITYMIEYRGDTLRDTIALMESSASVKVNGEQTATKLDVKKSIIIPPSDTFNIEIDFDEEREVELTVQFVGGLAFEKEWERFEVLTPSSYSFECPKFEELSVDIIVQEFDIVSSSKIPAVEGNTTFAIYDFQRWNNWTTYKFE